MGITGAGSVYEHLYGHSDRVITPVIKRDARSSEFANSASIDIVDMLTISIPCCRNLASKVATAMATSPGRPMGQFIVFFNPVNDIVHEIAYDANLVVRESDLRVTQDADDHRARDTLAYRQTLVGAGADSNVLRSVCHRASVLAKANPPLEPALVAVDLPSGHDELERLVNLAKDGKPVPLDKTSPCSGSNVDDDDNNIWYARQGIREGRFIKFANLHRNTDTNQLSSATTRFRCASLVQELEGLVLLYAWEVAQRLSNVLVKHDPDRPSDWRCLITVNDGISPPLKSLARERRFIANERRTVTKTDSLMSSCEQLLMKLQSLLGPVTVNDVIRIPLADATCAKTLYNVRSNLIEAENDMVSLTAMFTGLQTSAAWSYAYDRKTINKLEIGPLRSARSRNRLAECSFYRRRLSWKDVHGLILKVHESDYDRDRPCINLYSTDSDVLGKWNMVVAHHRALLAGGTAVAMTLLSSIRPRGVFFYRGIVVRAQAPIKVSALTSLERWKAASTSIHSSIRYDLLQSPICVTPETTLLIMLTRGSDYNDPIVSSRIAGHVDVGIRDEMALLLSGACRCLGGWQPFIESTISSAAAIDLNDVEDATDTGLVCAENVADEPCPDCGKAVVMPFWAIKAWFVGLGSKKECDASSNPHIREALNCAGNIMAVLTMGAFNKAVYGGSENQSTPKRGKGPVSVLRERMNSNFNEARNAFLASNTPGGIPANSDSLEREYRSLFGRQLGDDRKGDSDGFDDGSNCLRSATVDRTPNPSLTTNEQMADDKSALFWLSVIGDDESTEERHESDIIETIEGHLPNPRLMSVLMGAEVSSPNVVGNGDDDDDDDLKVTTTNFDPDLYKKALSDSVSSTCGRNILNQLSHRLYTNRHQAQHSAVAPAVTASASEKCVDLLVTLYLNMICYEDPAVVGTDELRTPMMHVDAIKKLKPVEAGAERAIQSDPATFNSAVTETVELLYSPGIGPDAPWHQVPRHDWTPIVDRLAKSRIRMEGLVNHYRSFMAERIGPTANGCPWIIGCGKLQPLLGFSRNRPWTSLTVWGLFLSDRYISNKSKRTRLTLRDGSSRNSWKLREIADGTGRGSRHSL
nr:MAG: wsv139-like protein [Marsupenaeus japonicus pemonivirus]